MAVWSAQAWRCQEWPIWKQGSAGVKTLVMSLCHAVRTPTLSCSLNSAPFLSIFFCCFSIQFFFFFFLSHSLHFIKNLPDLKWRGNTLKFGFPNMDEWDWTPNGPVHSPLCWQHIFYNRTEVLHMERIPSIITFSSKSKTFICAFENDDPMIDLNFNRFPRAKP